MVNFRLGFKQSEPAENPSPISWNLGPPEKFQAPQIALPTELLPTYWKKNPCCFLYGTTWYKFDISSYELMRVHIFG